MKKSLIITSLIALATLGCYVLAQTQGPVATSDKPDYAPGETAHFSASGFQGSELLDFSIGVSDDNGGWLPDVAWADIPANTSGSASVDYVVPETWANKTLQLTVMGLTSGLMAQTTFTDVPAPTTCTISATPAPPVNDGTIVHLTGTVSASPTATPSCGVVSIQISTNGGTTFADVAGTKVCAPAAATYDYNTTGHCSDSPAPQFRTHFDPGAGGIGCTVCSGSYSGSNSTPITVTITCPTPTPSASPTPTPCQNHPPTITCLTPAVDLGSVVGCLGVGNGFGQTFPISYSNDGPGTSVTVTAHITKPDTTVVDVDVATVTDSDGNSVTVTQSGTTSVTLNGPGMDTQPFSVTINADDGQDCMNTSSSMCGGTVSADIVYHVHYLPPLSDTATTKVKQGSTVPVKMQLTDCSGTPITPDNIPGGTPTLDHVQYISGVGPNGPVDIDDAGQSSGDTTYFRWTVDGMFWIFNDKTNTTYGIPNTYKLWPSDVDAGASISMK